MPMTTTTMTTMEAASTSDVIDRGEAASSAAPETATSWTDAAAWTDAATWRSEDEEDDDDENEYDDDDMTASSWTWR